MAQKTDKFRIKLGIYSCYLLMMGVIAVSSNIANIIAAFPEANQTTIITYLISVPCIVIIPMALLTGKLMERVAKKTLMLIGILCFLAGGCLPFFMDSLMPILVMRIIFGVGMGLSSTLCPALVMDYFEDPVERDKVTGTGTAFQMLGGMIFSIVSGNLGAIRWNVSFLGHLVALISLVGCILCIPYKKPEAVTASGEKVRFRPTPMMWVWVIAFFIFTLSGQTYSNFASSIITEKGLGSSAAAGYSLSIFALGGFIMGFAFAKVSKVCKRFTLTVGSMLLAVSYVVMTFASSLALSYVGALICGLAYSVCMPSLFTGAANSVDRNSSGMAVSLATCLQNAGMAVCPYFVTPLGTLLQGRYPSLSVNQGGMIVGMLVAVVLAVLFISPLNSTQQAARKERKSAA